VGEAHTQGKSESVIDRYGKGDTPVAAAQRARERYEHEQ
jgi:hypothetical protein